jgi:3-oxoacyl-[acyl-carrier protein] reductase
MSERAGGTDDSLAGFAPGRTESVSRRITAEDVAAFAALSGDSNALHVDEEFAARTEFRQRVAHGFLHASILSQLVGMKLPGRGALYLSQTLDFSKPVFIGDTVEARGTVEAVDPQTRILTLRTEIFNQHGERVLDGKAQVKVLRLRPDAPAARTERAPAMQRMLDGRIALVTGASRGIGRATAALLAAHGAHVLINYLKSRQAAESLLAAIEAEGGRASLIAADVMDDDSVARMIEAVGAHGRLDILVNNAGGTIAAAPFERQNWQAMAAAYESVVGPAFRVTQAALPLMQKAGGGRIVNVLSSAALGRTAHHWLPYVTAKSALLGFSKNLAQELGPRGITVNMVSPSLVDTDLVAGVPDRIRDMMVSRTPLRRLASVEDVAGAILMLVSPYAAFVSGDNLLVAGGDVMS